MDSVSTLTVVPDEAMADQPIVLDGPTDGFPSGCPATVGALAEAVVESLAAHLQARAPREDD